MFFQQDYAEPGPGVNPDAPEKTGVRRFLEILQLECVTIFKLNLLFLVSCIPVITIPPAIFAMNQVVRRMVLDRPVDCFYHYRLAFRAYWKQGYAAFFLVLVPLVLSGYGAAFYLRQAEGNFLLFLPFTLCSTVFFVTILASPYLYGLLSCGMGVREAVKLALPLGVGKPGRAVLAAVFVYGSLLASLLYFPLSVIYLLFLGFSFPCLIGNFYIRTVIKRFCPIAPAPDPGEEEEEA
ncbi:MAG: YesL family protein [Oscillibacter sp.]|nr:YesL family protein [Oscillibacter sp.]